MNYYINLTIQPDAETYKNMLFNKVYAKLHKAIYDIKASDIGVSFPEAKRLFGCVIRIHSGQVRLQEMQNLNWLENLSSYCKISAILPIPDKIKGYRTFSRTRQTMTNAKLKKRVVYQKSRGILSTDASVKEYIKQYKAKMFQTGLDNPYLELQSTSTKSSYRLYIVFGEVQKYSIDGEFNRFGLSKVATVPIF